MAFKVVISDPKTGKSYQREIKDEGAKKLRKMMLGDELDGSVLGLTGYKLKVTGGSDKCGFPMKKGIKDITRPKVLMVGGVGYRPSRDVKRRKRVRGERVFDDIVQINAKVTEWGSKSIEETLGIPKEEAKEKAAEAPKPEEKPKEEKKEKSQKEQKTE